IASTVQKIGEKIGVNVTVASQPGSDRDLLPSLRRLASASPPIDALYVFGSGPFGNIAMNQAELAGIEVPIFYTGGNIIPALVKNLSPEAAARVFFTTARGGVAVDTLPADDPYVDSIGKFAKAFEAKYGEGVTFPATVGYDMAHTVIDAIRNVGTDRDAIATYITEKQRISGVQGVEFERVSGEGYGIHPNELIIATIKDGGFAFKAYLSDSLENVGLTKDVLDQLMRDEQILPN
ncbi:MAG: hypothetical protein KUG69_12535, partial [Marinosulfonomonas sp.]|nr:hypothetical protein [Marinosulfonomonas sp.]